MWLIVTGTITMAFCVWLWVMNKSNQPVETIYKGNQDASPIPQKPSLESILAKLDLQIDLSISDVRAAFKRMQSLIVEYYDDRELCCRFALVCQRLCDLLNDSNEKFKLFDDAITHCDHTFSAMDSTKWIFRHKWRAILLGCKVSVLTNTSEKLNAAKAFKETLETAIKIDGLDWTLHSMYGYFQHELASLSWFEKIFASKYVEGTYEQAVKSYLNAEKLIPRPSKQNKVLLAKSYLELSNKTAAIKYLQSAKTIPAKSSLDFKVDREIEELLSKHR